MSLQTLIYFDNAASTPMLACALTRLNQLSSSFFGNSSSSHKAGRQALEIYYDTTQLIGRYFDVPPSHVIFTSGGTESNNLAVWGALGGLTSTVQWLKSNSVSGQLITSTIEHPSILNVFECFEKLGAPVKYISVNQEGFLNLDELESILKNRTRLVSVHHIQNEIGTVQDLRKISELVRSKQPDALIHTDAVQSFMKIPVSLDSLGVDLISLSSHKTGGPKGVGAIILGRRFERRTPKLGSFIQGSTQQEGIRPGTIPIPLVGTLASAIEWSIENFNENTDHLLTLRTHLIEKLPKHALLNGPKDFSRNSKVRAPQTVSFSLPGLPSAVVVEALAADGFCISAGSACYSTHPKPNQTLLKMKVPMESATSAVRVSFSVNNTTSEIDRFLTALNKAIESYQ